MRTTRVLNSVISMRAAASGLVLAVVLGLAGAVAGASLDPDLAYADCIINRELILNDMGDIVDIIVTEDCSGDTSPADDGQPDYTAESFAELIQESSLHRGHSTVLRLYWAVLDREPDVEGALFWLNGYNSGEWPIRRISGYFATSPEFVGKYGAELSNAEFVTVVYRNVLDRDPDVEGYGYWLGAVDGGMAREEMVLLISNAPEFVDSHVLPSDVRADTGALG